MYDTAEALYTTLDAMVGRLEANESFRTRIARANVAVAFKVRDLEAAYTLAFRQGHASGARGVADSPTIVVTLDAGTLDELLSGATSGESLYYSGRLTFVGDEYAAESAAYYLASLAPDYKAARGD